MERSAKQRNSILKVGGAIGKEDIHAASENITSKRISFSGKKMIRVFSGEDEAKTWDNSYEISDPHSNTSEEEKRTAGLANVQQWRANLHSSGVIAAAQAPYKVNRSSEPVLDKKNMLPSPNSLSASNESLYFANTMEYIDRLQQSTIHCIENSTEVSLHDQEKVCDLPSYSLRESEILARRRGQTADRNHKAKCSKNVLACEALRTKESHEANRRTYEMVYSSPVEVPEKVAPNYSVHERALKEISAFTHETQTRKNCTRLSSYDMEISYLNNQNCPQSKTSLTANQLEISKECDAMNLTVPSRVGNALESSWFLPETIDNTIVNEQPESMVVANAEQPPDENRETKFFTDDVRDFSFRTPSPAAVPPPRQSVAMPIGTSTAPTIVGSAAKRNGVIVTHRPFTPIRTPLKVRSIVGMKEEERAERMKVETPAESSPLICGLGSANTGSDPSLFGSSPLIPPECAAQLPKKANLRQLNDAITRGEIKLGPEYIAMSAGTPGRSRKSCRGTLNFANQMEISPSADPNKSRAIRGLAAGEECFEDTDMVLDNTSFYTKAKLDDETSSRNSTAQCSLSKRTIHFNAGVDETLNPVNLLLPNSTSRCEGPNYSTQPPKADLADVRTCVPETPEAEGQFEQEVGEVEKHSLAVALPYSIFHDRVNEPNLPVPGEGYRETILNEEAMHLDELDKTNSVRNSHEEAELMDAEKPLSPTKISSCAKNNTALSSSVHMNLPNNSPLHMSGSSSEERAEVRSKERKTTYAASMWESTPQRSFIEFLEREIEAEDAKNKTERVSKVDFPPHLSIENPSSWGQSPLRTSINNLKTRLLKKRLIANLTPQNSQSKKRQTILFADCKLDETTARDEPSEKPSMPSQGTMNRRPTNHWLESMDLDEGSKSHTSILRPVQQGSNNSVDAEGVNVDDMPNSFRTEPSKQELAETSAALNTSLDLTEAHTSGHSLHNYESRIPVRTETSCPPLYTSSLDASVFPYAMHSIEMLRRAPNTHGDTNDCVEAPKAVFGDNTIVISDVSLHYQTLKRQATADSSSISPSKSKRIISPMLSDEETATGMAKFAQNYINLTDYSLFHGAAEDNIDQTHLSLVSTLLDNETEDEGNKVLSPLKDETQANMDASPHTPNVKRHSLCRKCKRCQDTLLNITASSTADSFMLPARSPVKPMERHLERLRNLRKRPTILDVAKHFEGLSLELTQNNLTTSFKGLEEEDPMERTDAFIKSYKAEKERTRKELESKVLAMSHESFVDLLTQFASEHLPKWTVDTQLECIKTIRLSHHRLSTFRVQLQYEEKYAPSYTFHVKSLRVQSTSFLQKNWKPIDYILEFQRKLECPIDLMSLCENDDENKKFVFLRRLDDICTQVASLGINLWRIVCNERAALIRSGKMILVQKTVRHMTSAEDGRTPRVNKTVFEVEITDITNVCFKDIAKPPLHLFREDIQLLPTGLDFLQVFLRNPLNYLK